MQISTNQGGSYEFMPPSALAASSIWRHYRPMSNELVFPTPLVCPTDARTMATSWALTAATAGAGKIPFNMNQNISYFVGLDAMEIFPEMLLGGDRNVTNNTPSVIDVFRTGATAQIGFLGMNWANTNVGPGWNNRLHQYAGNIVLGDGSVRRINASELKAQLKISGDSSNRVAAPN